MGSKGRLPCKVTDGIIKPSKLKIKKDWGTSFLAEKQGDRWLLYKTHFQDKAGNVPAYISVSFFLKTWESKTSQHPARTSLTPFLEKLLPSLDVIMSVNAKVMI